MNIVDDHFYASFFWGPREESSRNCALRLFSFLRFLIGKFPRSRWKVTSRIGAFATKKTSILELEKVLLNGTNIGSKRLPILDLGYTVSIAAESTPPFSISRVHCGSWAHGVVNVCSVDFGSDGFGGTRIGCSQLLIELAEAAIEAWEPDRGLVSSQKFGDLLRPMRPEAGWMTYFSASYDDLVTIPAEFRLIRQSKGRLLVLDSEVFSVENPVQVSAIKSLCFALSSRNR